MRTPSLTLLALVVLALGGPVTALAQKLDKDDKRFLDEVRPILLPDEEKAFKRLKEKADRQEFQKIFWARRDPDLTTPENEYQKEYLMARAEAERLFRGPGLGGADSDCGRVFILLGKPSDVRQEAVGESPGARNPEAWVYRDRPGQTFEGGEAVIVFDSECRAAVALDAQLERVAAARIVDPNLDYRIARDGRLTKLVDMLPKDTPARALVKQPRRDFALTAQAAYLKVADGGTALLGLVRGEGAGLLGGDKGKTVVVVASATDEAGKEVAWAEQATTADVASDGTFVASFKLGLKPGRYSLQAGAVDPQSGKGSLASMPIEVPDFNRVEAAADGTVRPAPSVTSVLIVRDVEELSEGAPADPQHAYAAFGLGTARLVPVFGQVLRRSDAVSFFYQVYDLRTDPTTGKADGVAVLTVLKDGKVAVAKAPPNPIEGAVGGSVIGPVPLEKYEPGKYVVQLKLTDKLAQKDLVQEVPFEVQP